VAPPASDDEQPRAGLGGRLERAARAVSDLANRIRPGAKAERIVLGIALAGLVTAAGFATRRLPHINGTTHWPLLVIVGLVGIPVTVLCNAAEYALSAQIVGQRPGLVETLRVTVLSTAANLLPLPGSVVVRMQRLKTRGASYKQAIRSTAIVGLAWVGVTCALAGGLLIGHEVTLFSIILLVVGVVLLGISFAMLWTRGPHEEAVSLAVKILLVEAATVASVGVRWFLVLRALGINATFRQALALTIAAATASVIGIVPGGLGLREGLAAAIGVVVGLPAAAGLLATTMDRAMALIVLALMAGVLVLTTRGGRDAIAVAEEGQGAQ
jgi:hypothetical protein